MVTWQWKAFSELSVSELYSILQLREEVFILEQKCLYPDIDNQDQEAIHLLGIDQGQIVAYLRLFPEGVRYPNAISFGRFLTKRSARSQGLGKEAMRQLQLYLEKLPLAPLLISAQVYLQKFYEGYGFKPIGEPYDEDGIMHINLRADALGIRS